MFGKDWYKSKTLWFNVVYLVSLLASTVLGALGYGEFQPPPAVVEISGILLAVVNIVLRRWFTAQPIK